jgi:hypothetical protein
MIHNTTTKSQSLTPMIALHSENADTPYLNNHTIPNHCDEVASLLSTSHTNHKLDPVSIVTERDATILDNRSNITKKEYGVQASVRIDGTNGRKRPRPQHGFHFSDWTLDCHKKLEHDYEFVALKPYHSKIVGSNNEPSCQRFQATSTIGVEDTINIRNDDHVRDVSSLSSSSLAMQNPTNKKRRCQFDENVRVITIPARHEYTQRMKSRLWFDALELYRNIARNTMEYMSEESECRTKWSTSATSTTTVVSEEEEKVMM